MHSLSTNLLIAESSLTNQTCMIGIAAVKHTHVIDASERAEELRFAPVVNICSEGIVCGFTILFPTIGAAFHCFELGKTAVTPMMRAFGC